MALFNHSSCIALTWDASGAFQGVYCERHGDRVRVLRHWRGSQRHDRPAAAELLREAVTSLQRNAETRILVGGNMACACLAELRMPRLPPADLEGALRFELNKQTPISDEDLVWGYRLVGRIPDSDLYHVRVIFSRVEEWNSWVEAASGVPGGVDLIMPAIAALDPVLAERSVCLDATTNQPFFILEPEPHARRLSRRPANYCDENVFGLGEHPLDDPALDCQVLNELCEEDQRRFIPALILGAYGLSREFSQDQRYWPPPPMEMRPRRNRVQKVWTLLISIYLLFLLGLLGSSVTYRNYQELQGVNTAVRRVKKEIDKRRIQDSNVSLGEVLKEELTKQQLPEANVSQTLAYLSGYIPTSMWMTNFSWDGGDVRLEIRAEADDPNLLAPLMQASFLTDQQKRSRILPDGSVQYTIDARAVKSDAPLHPPAPVVIPSMPESSEMENPESETLPQDDADPGDTTGSEK